MKRIDPESFIARIWEESHNATFLFDFARSAFVLSSTDGANARKPGLPPGGERLACQLWLMTFDAEYVFMTAMEAYKILFISDYRDKAKELDPYLIGREVTA